MVKYLNVERGVLSMSFKQAFKDVNRLRQIADVLFRKEFGFVLEKLDLKHHLSLKHRVQRSEFKKYNHVPPVKVREAMEELGGAFVKLGQLLSLRPDLIPREYAEEFEKLQDAMPGFEFAKVKAIVEKELGHPLHDLFLKFETEPLAAASIGQVHKAWLKNGKKVVVKVKRPGIEDVFMTDIDLLRHLAHLLENKYPAIKDYDFKGIIDQFEEYTKDELDYQIEAHNLDIFCQHFRRDIKVKIPQVHHDFTTKNVLTLEFIDGFKLSSLKPKENPFDRRIVTTVFVHSIIKQVLEHGLFHADPHPGNVLVLRDNKIAFLDFGIVGKIRNDLKPKVQNIFVALSLADRDLLADAFIDVGIVGRYADTEQLKKDLSKHLGQYYDLSLRDLDMKEIFFDVLDLARTYKMKFPPDFVLLLKAMATAEGLAKKVCPEFKYVESWKQYAKTLMKKEMGVSYTFENFKRSLFQMRTVLNDVPGSFRKLLIGRNNLKVDVNDLDIAKFTYRIDTAINRIAFGVIIGALLVSAAFIAVNSQEISVLVWVYLGVAVILGLILIKSINREKGGV